MLDLLSNKKIATHFVLPIFSAPPSSLPGISADEEEDRAKVKEKAVIKVLENLEPKVGDCGFQFSEQSPKLPSPAPIPQVPLERCGESEGYLDKEENLQHLFQAAKQLQRERQQRASPSSPEGSAFSPGPHTFPLQRQPLSKPDSQKGKGLLQGEVSVNVLVLFSCGSGHATCGLQSVVLDKIRPLTEAVCAQFSLRHS